MSAQIAAIKLTEPSYPSLLREIPDPPKVLFCRGSPAILNRPSVAIVGARRCTKTGREAARKFAEQLARRGVVVISGLAHGIDTAAHEGALIGGGATAAVLGCGVDRVYPARNSALAIEILRAGGALLSEYAPGTPPAKFRFPERNRIISGLVTAVLVVEASDKSGSLITARMALEQGRDVLAMPGSVANPTSHGCLKLIKEGAALIDSVQTLFFELGIPEQEPEGESAPKATSVESISSAAEVVMRELSDEPLTEDDLCRRLSLKPEQIMPLLLELELAGFVARSSDGYIRRSILT